MATNDTPAPPSREDVQVRKVQQLIMAQAILHKMVDSIGSLDGDLSGLAGIVEKSVAAAKICFPDLPEG